MLPPIRSLADVEAIEATPLDRALAHRTPYDALVARVRQQPDAPALIVPVPGDVDAPATTIGYGEFLAEVHRFANALHTLGLRSDETVASLLPVCPQAMALVFAGAATGIVSAVNFYLEPWQIVKILAAADAKMLVVPGPALDEEIWHKIVAIKDQLPDLKAVIRVGDGPPVEGIVAYDEIVAGQPDDRLISGRAVAPEDVAAYFHTGGTTGTPKLAIHTHYMHAVDIHATGIALGLGPEDRFISGLPLFHIGGSVVGTIVPLCRGVTLILAPPHGWRDPRLVRDHWRLVHRYGLTLLVGVPTVLGALLNMPLENADLSSVRYTITGGAILPLEVAKAFVERTGRIIVEGYGMTESSSYTNLIPRDGEGRIGSVGVRLPYVEVKPVVLDADGAYLRDCETDEIGVIAIKGASVMPAYKQEVYNENAFLADGWLNSGDLGRLDGDGHLWITGRAKDLIIRGGHNIDPAVIEECLHEHPAIEIAAAVGKPDSYAGEVPIAYVQLKPGESADPEELRGFVRERIAERAANPTNIFVLDQMPLTGVGKVFKPKLRWDAAERVYREIAAPIVVKAGGVLAIEVAADDRLGALATLTVSGIDDGAREAVKTRIEDGLAPFALAREIRFA